MIFRISGCFALLLFAAGCSGLSSLTSFDQDPAAPPAAVAPPPEPAAALVQPSDWCQRIALDARDKAAAGGFDVATQTRMTQQAFQQCTAMAAQG